MNTINPNLTFRFYSSYILVSQCIYSNTKIFCILLCIIVVWCYIQLFLLSWERQKAAKIIDPNVTRSFCISIGFLLREWEREREREREKDRECNAQSFQPWFMTVAIIKLICIKYRFCTRISWNNPSFSLHHTLCCMIRVYLSLYLACCN